MITATKIIKLHGNSPDGAPIVESKPFMIGTTIMDVAARIISAYQDNHKMFFKWYMIKIYGNQIIHVVSTPPYLLSINCGEKPPTNSRPMISDYFLIAGESEPLSSYSSPSFEKIIEDELLAPNPEEPVEETEANRWVEWYIKKHTPWIGELALKENLQKLLTEIITDVYKKLKNVDQD